MLPASISLKFLPISISIDVLAELFKDVNPIERISIVGSSLDSEGRYCEATITFGPGVDARRAVQVFHGKVSGRIGEMYIGSEPHKIQCKVLSQEADIPKPLPMPRPGLYKDCTRMTVATHDRKKKGCISLNGKLMVRFAIVPACNVLRLRYKPTMALYRTVNEKTKYDPWILPGSFLPCTYQTEGEVFEIRTRTEPAWQSGLTDVITLTVEDITTGTTLDVQISKSSKCFLIPTYFGDMVTPPVKMNSYTVMKDRGILIDTCMTVENAGLEDGDCVFISPRPPAHHPLRFPIEEEFFEEEFGEEEDAEEEDAEEEDAEEESNNDPNDEPMWI